MSSSEVSSTMATFFIADRLRGIPLVSSGREKRQQQQSSTQTPTSNILKNKLLNDEIATTWKSESSSSTIGKDGRQVLGANERSVVGVGKRDARYSLMDGKQDNNDVVIEKQVTPSILFRPSAITASTSNLVRKKPIKPTSTTTRRPTTTTTSRRPPIRRTYASVAQMRQPPAATTTTTKAPTTMALMNQARMSLEPTIKPTPQTTTPKPLDKLQVEPKQQASSQMVIKATLSSPELAQTGREETPAANLTRTTQSLTTQPGFQRRTPQSVSSPRFTNRPADGRSAGENWELFNRADGQFSVFEILAIMSNIMIVCAVIFVIVYTRIKSIRRKRAIEAKLMEQQQLQQQQLQQQQHQQPETTTLASTSKSPTSQVGTANTDSDGAAMTSGSNSVTTTAILTSEVAAGEMAARLRQQQQRQVNDAIETATDLTGRMATSTGEGSKLDFGGTNLAQSVSSIIASEFSGGPSNKMANKAMAIVQPTENTNLGKATMNGAALAKETPTLSLPAGAKDSDKLMERQQQEAELKQQNHDGQTGQRSLNRSASDLSGSPRASKQVEESSQSGRNSADRVRALEKLFDGSSEPNLSTAKRTGNEAKKASKLQEEEEEEKKRELIGKEEEKLVAEMGSLESVELPSNLVDSIKRSEARFAGAKDEAPSPNLLLGEVGPPLAPPPPAEKVAATKQVATGEPQVKGAEKKTAGKSEGAEQSAKGGQVKSGAAGGESGKPATNGAASKTKSRPVASKAAISRQSSGAKLMSNTSAKNNSKRPENPMAKELVSGAALNGGAATTGATEEQVTQIEPPEAKVVMNHQVVVNKLDKRKTNLEIVDIRDESVTGKMRNSESGGPKELLPGGEGDPGKPKVLGGDQAGSWISMDGVAVVQPISAPSATNGAQPGQAPSSRPQSGAGQPQSPAGTAAAAAGGSMMSPSEIIESRFHVDYKSKRARKAGQPGESQQLMRSGESLDSKMEETLQNDIENELELDNRMRNRKYFVYVVQDGHFTAKKECLARIELPPKRRITLAELRQLISTSQDISLSSLRKNKFKFVTETYRLLNENEDAAVLHQVYPTQGVFLKLNIPDQENPSYPYKSARNRLPSGSTGGGAGAAAMQTTISSRRRANNSSARGGGGGGQAGEGLPAIEVNYATGAESSAGASSYGRTRASSVGRRAANRGGPADGPIRYQRSKSSLQGGRRSMNGADGSTSNRLPSIGFLDEANLNERDLPDSLVESRKMFSGTQLAEMSDNRMRIKPRWKVWGQ